MATTAVAHPWVLEGEHRIRFGVSMLGPRRDWGELIDWAIEAEALGFDGWWAQDHPVLLLDCWLVLAALAQRTRTLRLGTIVSCVYYRNPVLLARLASDVDRLSGGRLVLGVGIGDHPEEFAHLGIPLASVRERQHVLEETVQILRGLWSGEPFTFSGNYFQIESAAVPPPDQRPHVPLLIGGGGERVTLRQVAQYADMCNFGEHEWAGNAANLDDVRRKLAALRGHCAALGRSEREILRSHVEAPLVLAGTRAALEAKLAAMPAVAQRSSLIAGTPDEAVAYYRALVEVGMRYFIAMILPGDRETLEVLGRAVLPEFANA